MPPTNAENEVKLSPELLQEVAARLQPKDVSTFKLLNKKAAAALRGSLSTIRLECVTPFKTRKNLVIARVDAWPGDAFARDWGRPDPWQALSLRRRIRLLCLAASSHHAPSLEAALAHSGVGLEPIVLEAAAAAGDLDAFLRLLAAGCETYSSRALEVAAQCGHLAILQCAWYYSLDGVPLRRTFNCGAVDVGSLAVAACAGGQGHVLTWLESLAEPPAAALAAMASAAASAAAVASGAPGLSPAPAVPTAGRQRGSAKAKPAHVLARERLDDAVFSMVSHAATNGRVQLLDRLLQPKGSHMKAVGTLTVRMYEDILLDIAHGCPLDTLRRYCEAWVPDLVGASSCKRLFTAALRSPTGDWQHKCDFVLFMAARMTALEAQVQAAAAAAEEESAGAAHAAKFETAAQAVDAVSGEPVGSNYERHVTHWDVAAEPGFLERVRYLTPLGLPNERWQPHVALALAAAGNAVDLHELLNEWSPPEDAKGARQRDELVGDAMMADHVPVLMVLAERFGRQAVFNVDNLEAAVLHDRLAAVEYLASGICLEAPGSEGTTDSNNNSADCKSAAGKDLWDRVFSQAAVLGGGLPVLRLLHERRSAAINLAAVATGGSVESVAWAVAALRAAGQNVTITTKQLWGITAYGNLGTATWLLDHGLLLPAPRQTCSSSSSSSSTTTATADALPHPADCPHIADYEPDEDAFDSAEPRPSNCIRLWVALQAGSGVAGAPVGAKARACSTNEWIRLEGFVKGLLQPHQQAWLRRQRPQELQLQARAQDQVQQQQQQKQQKT